MNRPLRHCLAKLVCLALILLLNGIVLAYRKDLIFTYLGVKEGLSQSSVFCILKDHNGFMWFGTLDGLNRYDGLSFTIYHYQVDNPESLSSSSISCLFEDSKGRLWVGTDNGGLNWKESGISRFHHFRHDPNDSGSIISDSIESICEDRQGNLWIGTNRGLDCLAAGSGRFTHYQPITQDTGTIASSSANSVLIDRLGNVWVGLRDKGVDCYHPDTGLFVHYRHDPKNEQTLASDIVGSICLAPDGTVWAGHDKGWVSRLRPETGQVQRYHLGQELERVRSIFADPNGNIWAGSTNGLFFLNPTNGEMINIRSNPRVPATLSGDSISCVYVDDADILWVSIPNFGVNKANLKAKRFINYTHDPTNPNSLGFDFVRGIYENRDGTLYVGGEGSLDRYDPKTETWKHFVVERTQSPPSSTPRGVPPRPFSETRNPTVYCICPNSDDGQDFLWIGTEGGGLYTFDQKRQVIRPHPIPGFHGDRIYGIYKDKEGSLWISTNEGLNHYNPGKRENHYYDLRKEAGLDPMTERTVDVNLVLPDRYGVLWVGTTEDGVLAYDPRTKVWRHFSHDPANPRSLSHNRIPAILETRAGELWISTYGGGLNRFDRSTGTFDHFTTSKGLPNDVVYGIIEDDEGLLWISTNRGLCRFNSRTGTFRSYTDKDGLIINEFNSKAYHQGRWSGRIYFGGIKGVTAFFPKEVMDDPHPPTVVLEDFKIFNRSVVPGPQSVLKKPIGETDSISLSYSDSMLTFEFNGLHYVAPAKNHFAYFLEGFDHQWNQTDAQRRYATYTNLNPGHYMLRIKAANCDDVWNEKGKTLKIFIAPPFWKTWWFTLLSIVLATVLLVSIYHYRVRGLQKRKAELEKLVALRTQELREMSLRDPLTGLRNRRFLSEVLKTELRSFINVKKFLLTHQHRRNEDPATKVCGVFMIDVDRFKAVNDTYGHDAGDRFLIQLSDLLCHSIREDDVVVRMGGEEFLIVLKKTDPSYLPVFAKKVKDKIEAMTFDLGNNPQIRLQKTCSIGFASFPFYREIPDFISFDQVVTLVDLGLLHAKASGRNAAVYVKPGETSPASDKISTIFVSLDDGIQNRFIQVEIIK